MKDRVLTMEDFSFLEEKELCKVCSDGSISFTELAEFKYPVLRNRCYNKSFFEGIEGKVMTLPKFSGVTGQGEYHFYLKNNHKIILTPYSFVGFWQELKHKHLSSNKFMRITI